MLNEPVIVGHFRVADYGFIAVIFFRDDPHVRGAGNVLGGEVSVKGEEYERSDTSRIQLHERVPNAIGFIKRAKTGRRVQRRVPENCETLVKSVLGREAERNLRRFRFALLARNC